jgi:LysM repeat protein
VAVPLICPYLIADDGAWRSSRPSRDHRCAAVTPAAALALDKQRRLCLGKAHSTCATHLAALAEAGGPPYAPAGDGGDRAPLPGQAGATRWSIVRTAPVVLDVPGGGSPGGRGPRRVGQWALAGLMALALGAVLLARLPDAAPTATGSPAVLGATGGPAAAGLVSATPRPRAAVVTPAPESVAPSRVSRPSDRLTATPTAIASASMAAVHVVAPGETLSALARAYGTTVEALQEANDLGTSTTIQIGQELELP